MNFPVSKIAKIIIGVLIIPVTFLALITFTKIIYQIEWVKNPYVLMTYGFFLYIPVFFISGKKSFLYVIGHEISHAVTSFLFGGKILSVTVSQDSGKVRTTKSNVIISLAPYCIPFFGMCLTLIYFILSMLIRTQGYLPYFKFLLGISVSHHLCFTVYYLKTKQTDITKQSVFLSYNLIILSNIAAFLFLIDIFFDKGYVFIFSQKMIWQIKSLLSNMITG